MLTKNIFRTEIREVLLEQMVSGNIRPGDRISLPTLAKQLAVSVTPVREALTQLTETGIVTYIANRGFFATELTEKEAIDVYEVITLLECEAIRKTAFSAQHLAALEAINEKFRLAKQPVDRLKLDMDFHRKLTENCGNQYVLKIVEDIRVRIYIYEHAFMSSEPVEDSANMHQRIIEGLRSSDLDLAVGELTANWQISIKHILLFYHSKAT